MLPLKNRLELDHPSLKFVEGQHFSWSPKDKTITYSTDREKQKACWALLHELAHAELEHSSYETDFELLLLEVAAWNRAKELADNYEETLDDEHIQDCLDTYRDWLYQRSNCPACSTTSLQETAVSYRCFNCGSKWTVTASRFCRPYRLMAKQQKTPLEAPKNLETTFL